MAASSWHRPARRLLAIAIAAAALAGTSSAFRPHAPHPLLFVILATLVAATAPGAALALTIAAVPLLTTTTAALHSPSDWTAAAVLCLIAGFFVREAVIGPDPTRPIPVPLALFAATVAASLVVGVVRTGATSFHDLAALADAPPRFFPPLHAAALLLEGTALFWVALNASPPNRQRAIRVLAIAGAGAATLNVYRAAQILLRRQSTLAALWDLTTRIRINLHFPDVNAAGSYFTIPLFIALDRARRPGRWRGVWIAMSVVTAAAVWLTGSRAAVLAAAALVLLMVIRTAVSSSAPTSRLAARIAIVVIALAIAVASTRLPHRFAGQAVSNAVDIRMGMARAAVGMVAAHPILGVGIGRFYDESSDYMPPDVHKFYAHENAHDNFLQILAELGLTGFGCFVWLLWWSLRPTVNDVRSLWKSGEWIGIDVGVIVFLITCLAGHPLLIPEVAWVFWIAVGLAAGGQVGVKSALARHRAPQRRAAFRWASRPMKARVDIADKDALNAALDADER